jgi:hypothetical protein
MYAIEMKSNRICRCVTIVAAVICVGSCRSVGPTVYVTITGPKSLVEVSIDSGACSPVEVIEPHKDGVLASSTCQTPKGNRRISARCTAANLPAAFLDVYVAGGSNDFAIFRNLCAKSEQEIKDENARAKAGIPVWGK